VSTLGLQAILKVLLFFFRHLSALKNTLNLLLNVSIRFLENISFSVEHIDIVIERVVLFLSLDESRYNFFNVGNA
jgi:hypothetical protein